MIARILSIFSLLALATSQTCTSLASVVQGDTNSPPAGLGIPDCAYLTANSAAICNTMAAWDIANTDTCYLKGPGYGCQIVAGSFSTTNSIYCQLGPAAIATATASSSATTSATASSSASASASASATASSSVTPTPSASATPSLTATPTPSTTPSLTATPTPSTTSSLTATPTPSTTPSLTATSSFTPFPSTNITIIYEIAPITKGVAAAIGLSSIFGMTIVLACCAFIGFQFRRSRPNELLKPVVLTERRTSIVAVVERRNSKASESRKNSVVTPAAERRKSTLELRAVQVDTKERT